MLKQTADRFFCGYLPKKYREFKCDFLQVKANNVSFTKLPEITLNVRKHAGVLRWKDDFFYIGLKSEYFWKEKKMTEHSALI